MPWKPFIASESDVEYAQGLLGTDLRTPSHDVLSVFADLRTFSASANMAAQTTRKIDPELFQEVLISVNYRLMLLESKKLGADGSFELLCLAMLAFSASVFLQTACHGMIFGILTTKIVSIMSGIGWATNAMPSAVNLWIQFMLAMTSLKTPDHDLALDTLGDLVRRSALTTWTDMRTMLKRVLWINALHDRVGEQIFNQVLLRGPPLNHIPGQFCKTMRRCDTQSTRLTTAVVSEHGLDTF
jgi:hypothetical protein